MKASYFISLLQVWIKNYTSDFTVQRFWCEENPMYHTFVHATTGLLSWYLVLQITPVRSVCILIFKLKYKFIETVQLKEEHSLYDVFFDWSDVWSAGCVLAELLLGQPIFPGDSGVDQLVEIIKVLGTPTREQIREMNPNYTEFKFPQIKAHPWTKVKWQGWSRHLCQIWNSQSEKFMYFCIIL